MAQTGFTPIQIYFSTTASNVPLNTNLTNGELAINSADGKLFYKDSGGTVQTIAWKTTPVTAGGTGAITAPAALVNLLPSYTGNANKRLTVNAGATDVEWIADGGGTVTSVAALTLGTTGTDLTSTVATGTTTPVITLQVPTASASNRGALSSTDWSTFNGKQAALVSGTSIKTVNGTSLLGSGDVGTIDVAHGGTGLTTLTTNYIPYGAGTSAFSSSAGLTFDGTNFATTGTSSAVSFTSTGGRSTLSAASEPYALGVKYVSSGGVVYFGANSSSATPDGQISNGGGSSIAIFKNSRVVQFPGYGAGAVSTDASGNIVVTSDETAKNHIRPFTRGLNEIVAIAETKNGVILHGYTLESGLDQTKTDYAGWSAQVVQQNIPEAVGKMSDTLDADGNSIAVGCLTLNSLAISAAMTNAIKELNDLIKTQSDIIAIMQTQISALTPKTP
jgi:hypothetical protein